MRLFILLFAPAIALAQPDANVQMCAGCHGANGAGNPQMGAPRITGQPEAYLARQLDAYANGQRQHAVMSPIAKQLSADARKAAAHYYAEQKAPAAKRSSAAGGSRAAASRLATRGDESREIQACQNCHGPEGSGVGANPYLAGLDERYLQSSLAEWKNGRNTDPSAQMPRIAKQLNEADIKALASYYSAQPSPEPRQSQPPPKPSPHAATPAPKGTAPRTSGGVEGEEPSGSQGPGGAGSK
jgi:cytochrome c553